MTAVAVHNRNHPRQQFSPRQTPHSSKPSSTSQSPRSQTNISPTPVQTQHRDVAGGASSNGGPSIMNTRAVARGETSRAVMANGIQTVGQDPAIRPSTANIATDRTQANDPSQPDYNRPTSAPGRRADSVSSFNPKESGNEESDNQVMRRRPKHLFHRSKSDFGPRGDDSDSPRHDSDNPEWGARHGFEDHYASEDFLQHLTIVSCSLTFGRDRIL
jgi:regulator-associated protein of mTOR